MVRTGDKQGPKRLIRSGTRVLVRDLPEKVRKTSLQSAFGDFGNVVRIELMPEQRTAYIEYEEPRDAEDAAKEMDGKMVEKAKVRAKLMDDRPRAAMDHAIRVQEACLAHLETRAAEHQQRIFGGRVRWVWDWAQVAGCYGRSLQKILSSQVFVFFLKKMFTPP
ncbi:unnamed protein product [Effrenium voratum]|nr:unnamed protein product [Effrenium voratum]